jgi:SecD/SecF fusion protein
MLQRGWVIGLTCLTALFLLFLQNRVLTGNQDITLLVQPQSVGTAAIELVDVSRRPIVLRDGVDGTVEEQIKKLLKGNVKRDQAELHFSTLELSADRRSYQMTFDPAAVSELALRRRVHGHVVQAPNPPRSLWHQNLGIDLRGGVEFITRLYDRNNMETPATEDEVTVLRQRLDARGLTEPQVFRLQNGDVQVVIPGGTEADAARTRKVLETTGFLEIREVKPVASRHAQFGSGDAYTRAALDAGVIKQNEDGTYGFGRRFGGKGFNDEIYPAKPEFVGEEPTLFYHLGRAEITGEMVESAAQGFDEHGGLAVNITLTVAGGVRQGEFTARVKNSHDRDPTNYTGNIAVSLDGVVYSAPRVINPSTKNTQITGSFTQEEVETLKTVFKAGSLTVTPRVRSERIVGPSLGAATIGKAANTMSVAMVFVLFSMMLFYKPRLGGVAAASLATCVALIFVILSIFEATLTLPGLAGLVLTVGMAVDANILIFERLREELRQKDIDVPTAIDAAFSRAFITILDANLTTFITALILYVIGSGPVQGFGLTLMIGIATSMFAALYVGRFLIEFFFAKRAAFTVPQLVPDLKFNYLGMRMGAAILSTVLIVSGLIHLSQNENKFDIDFTGGVMMQTTFNEPMTEAQVSAALDAYAASDPEGHSHYASDAVQKLPYFSGWDKGDGSSRQWMFKLRDQEGAAIERGRAALETDRGRAFRAMIAEQQSENGDAAVIANLRQEIEALDAKIFAKDEEVEARQAVIQEEFRHAFPGILPVPGSVIAAANWNDGVLSMQLGVIEQVKTEKVAALADRLTAVEYLNTAEVTVIDDHSLQFTLAFAEDPDEPGDYEVAGSLSQRFFELFANDQDEDVRLGHTKAAEAILETVFEQMGEVQLTPARAFPSSEYFSPQVAAQMKIAAAIAMAVALVAVLAYVAARFEFIFGLGALAALLHDVLLTIGLLSIVGVRIDLTVVAAVLTIIGYSLNDTIVVFDRVREFIKERTGDFADLINSAIATTMSRTVLTSATTILVVLLLVIFGGDGVYSFSMTLLIGLLVGTYSSVFVASPVVFALRKDGPSAADIAEFTNEEEIEPGVEPDYHGPEPEVIPEPKAAIAEQVEPTQDDDQQKPG